MLAADQGIRPLVKGIHGFDTIAFFDRGEVGIDCFEQAPTFFEAGGIDPAGQGQILDLEPAFRRITAEGKRPVGTAEVAALRIFIRHRRHADVGRKIVAGAKFMTDDRPHAGESESRAGAVAGEHVVRPPFMRGLAVGHRMNDRQAVSDLRRFG